MACEFDLTYPSRIFMDTRGSILLVGYINFILVGYGLRDMYKPGMSELEVLLYQMDQLISEHSSELANHFNAQGFATSTFASRWFLTLFSAVFPKVRPHALLEF